MIGITIALIVLLCGCYIQYVKYRWNRLDFITRLAALSTMSLVAHSNNMPWFKRTCAKLLLRWLR